MDGDGQLGPSHSRSRRAGSETPSTNERRSGRPSIRSQRRNRVQVASIVAEFLGLPQINDVVILQITDGNVHAEREIEGGHEVIETKLPAVISAQKGLNEPRYPSLKGIMAAKKKPLAVMEPMVYLTPRLQILKVVEPAKRKGGIKVKTFDELIDKLKNEAKVL